MKEPTFSEMLSYCQSKGSEYDRKIETAGKFIKHILRYVNDLDPETEDKEVLLSFIPVKQNLKRQLKKWEEIKEKRSIAGQISAEKRKQNSTNSTHVESIKQNKPLNIN